jgi:hypothetical protein
MSFFFEPVVTSHSTAYFSRAFLRDVIVLSRSTRSKDIVIITLNKTVTMTVYDPDEQAAKLEEIRLLIERAHADELHDAYAPGGTAHEAIRRRWADRESFDKVSDKVLDKVPDK